MYYFFCFVCAVQSRHIPFFGGFLSNTLNYLKKSIFVSSRKQSMDPLENKSNSGRCRYIHAIVAYPDIFKHKQTYSQAYAEPSVPLTYLEPWYIQNQMHIQGRGLFRTRSIFRAVVYSEH